MDETSIAEWESELTGKERLFVREYLVDLNATQAAVRAGYSHASAANIGWENVRKPQIAAAIEQAMADRASRTNITADRVLQELAKIGFSDIRKAIRWRSHLVTEEPNDGGGDVLVVKTVVTNTIEMVASDEIDDDTAAAIAEVKQTVGGGMSFKMHDKKGALVDLGRHLGLFRDKVDVKIEDNRPIDEVRASVAGKLARARAGAAKKE